MINQFKHNRRSIRLKGFDYSKQGLYFITLCTNNREHIFGQIKDGTLELNQFGKIAYDEWLESTNIRNNISLGEFIIMPNHMHGIICIEKQISTNNKIGEFKSPSNNLGAIIRGYKGSTTKKINQLKRKDTGVSQYTPKDTGVLQYAPNRIGSIWQRNYYEHIIRTEKAFNNISNYIINNPKNWGKDKLK